MYYMDINNNKEFITIKEYLKETGHTPQNVYRWIREGKINKEDLSLKVVEVQMINRNLILKKKWSHKQNQPSTMEMETVEE